MRDTASETARGGQSDGRGRRPSSRRSPGLFLSLLAVCAATLLGVAAAGRHEDSRAFRDEWERRALFLQRHNNTWPIDSPYNFRDPRDLAKVEAELMKIPGSQERWDMWMRHAQELITRNFTANGAEVAEVPSGVSEALYAYVHAHLDEALDEGDEEDRASAITSTGRYPTLLDLPPALKTRLVDAVQPMNEKWCNCKLKFTACYGARVYYDGNVLACHLDKTETHVISNIVHVGHDLLEPWPVEIRDHHGRWLSSNLEPGQLLHYESAKLTHCRMTQMRGSWYANVFVHFAPVDWNETVEDTEIAVPPFWMNGVGGENGHPSHAAETDEMLGGLEFGSKGREEAVVRSVRAFRDARGWAPVGASGFDALADPTRARDEGGERRSLEERDFGTEGLPEAGPAVVVSPRNALAASNAVRGSDTLRWLGIAFVAAGAALFALHRCSPAHGTSRSRFRRRASRSAQSSSATAAHQWGNDRTIVSVGGDEDGTELASAVLKDL